MINVKKYIDSIVKTSESKAEYPLPPDLTVNEWVNALNTLKKFNVDEEHGCLMPPRLTFHHVVPTSLEASFEEVVQQLDISVHPAVIHMLLAIALDAKPEDRKETRTKALAQWLEKHQSVMIYPINAIFLSSLHPEHFMTSSPITLSILGTGLGGDVEHKNSTASLYIKKENLRISSSHLFSSKKAISVANNFYFESKEELESSAIRAFHGKKALNNNFWLMGYGEKDIFKSWITPSSALLSPFYSLEEIDNITKDFFQVSQSAEGVSFLSGIQDVYPNLKDETVFFDYVHPCAIESQPLSTILIKLIAKALVSDKNQFMVSEDFFKNLLSNKIQLQMLDLIPTYSYFHEDNEGGLLLTEYADKQVNFDNLKSFVLTLLKTVDVNDPSDVLTIGEIPGSYSNLFFKRDIIKDNYEQTI